MMRIVRGKLMSLMDRLKSELAVSYLIWGMGHYSARFQHPDYLKITRPTRTKSSPQAGVDPEEETRRGVGNEEQEM